MTRTSTTRSPNHGRTSSTSPHAPASSTRTRNHASPKSVAGHRLELRDRARRSCAARHPPSRGTSRTCAGVVGGDLDEQHVLARARLAEVDLDRRARVPDRRARPAPVGRGGGGRARRRPTTAGTPSPRASTARTTVCAARSPPPTLPPRTMQCATSRFTASGSVFRAQRADDRREPVRVLARGLRRVQVHQRRPHAPSTAASRTAAARSARRSPHARSSSTTPPSSGRATRPST